MNGNELIRRAEARLHAESHHSWTQASPAEIHQAVSGAAMEMIADLWMAKEEERSGKRQAYYLSAEYLVGRLVYNNLFCMGVLDEVSELLREKGTDPAVLEDIEDAALGNGGLGRLAACFLDSAVSCDIPLTGYGLRYRFGLFRQTFVNGKQHEDPDDWSAFGDPWSVRRSDEAVTVRMKTGDVRAVPYDMPVIGYGARNVGTLRLWQCESTEEIDFRAFNEQKYLKASEKKNKAEDITKFLYPNDSGRQGRQMRIKQQYVLVSASLQDILRKYHSRHGADLSCLEKETAAQLNDTHPVMAIPEWIRLLEGEDMSFDEAFDSAFRVFSYTNHTVMQEALEKWDLSLLRSVCPEIAENILRINERFLADMKKRGIEPAADLSIVWNKQAQMAQLAVYATHATNGVAEIHTEILKNDVFSAWYDLYPERFQNKTNGITPRRWLGLCNRELCGLLDETIGPGYLEDLDRLGELKQHMTGPEKNELCRKFADIKAEKKRQLCEAVLKREGIRISPDMVFDVHVKRLHEYKRQLLNAFGILAIYYGLKDGTITDLPPVCVIFGAKAAPGYDRAKAIIRLINLIAEKVNTDQDTKDVLKVVFVQEYNCSWAEKIIPAADLSEQISPAGTEASGTGNMKLMLNGAVTLGTYDGANIEIVREAGEENNYIFGAKVDELNRIRDSYDPVRIAGEDPELLRCLESLIDGTFPDEDGMFKELYDALTIGASWHQPDHYFLMKDFRDYMTKRLRAIRDAADRVSFAEKALMNVASAGKFSSDRTIRQYADEIWDL